MLLCSHHFCSKKVKGGSKAVAIDGNDLIMGCCLKCDYKGCTRIVNRHFEAHHKFWLITNWAKPHYKGYKMAINDTYINPDVINGFQCNIITQSMHRKPHS